MSALGKTYDKPQLSLTVEIPAALLDRSAYPLAIAAMNIGYRDDSNMFERLIGDVLFAVGKALDDHEEEGP